MKTIAAFLLLCATVCAQPPAQVANPCTVRINVVDKVGGSHGSGVYAEPGFVLTANHVVADRRSNHVTVDFPTLGEMGGEVIATDKRQDLALIYCCCKDKMPEFVKWASKPAPGAVLAIEGYGHGTFKRQEGTYSSKRFGDSNATWEQVDGASARSGDSGGPVYYKGKLLGILWGSDGKATLFTPIDIVRKFVEENAK